MIPGLWMMYRAGERRREARALVVELVNVLGRLTGDEDTAPSLLEARREVLDRAGRWLAGEADP